MMLKKLGLILLTMSISVLLSSCHIKKKDEETISRTTTNLRVYQPGDVITYNVIAVSNSGTTSQGTLRVEWEQTPDLTDPIDGSTKYPVLKETTTLTYNPDSTEANATIIRYIHQETSSTAPDNSGQTSLYAIGGGTSLYWLYNPDNVNNPSSDIILPVIFDSPMKVGTPPPNSPLTFSVMEDCGVTVGQCGAEIYKFDDNFTIIGDTTPVTTNLGKFSNPFEIEFFGATTPKNSPATSFPGDIRSICGTSADQVSYNGTMFVMPEIGMVRMVNLCQNSTSGGVAQVNYIITLNNTNIPLP